MAVIRGEALRKTWGNTTALDGASFEIGKGVTGLLGPNGAGKTTLIGLMLGLHTADSGMLTVLDRNPATAGAAVRGRLGYSPEHEALPTDTKAQDIVRQLAEIHGLPRKAATARASDVLQEVGLGEERFRPVGTMSTGQKQRVKLAAAMVHGPEILLLDEPTNGLDPVQRDEMLALIRRIGSNLGIDVVLCSHLLEEVEQVADAVVILESGRVVREGAMTDLAGSEAELVVTLDDSDRRLQGDHPSQAPQGRCLRGGRVRWSLPSPATRPTTRCATPWPARASASAAWAGGASAWKTCSSRTRPHPLPGPGRRSPHERHAGHWRLPHPRPPVPAVHRAPQGNEPCDMAAVGARLPAAVRPAPAPSVTSWCRFCWRWSASSFRWADRRGRLRSGRRSITFDYAQMYELGCRYRCSSLLPSPPPPG